MSARSSVVRLASAAMSAEARVSGYDWQALIGELDNYGCAVLPTLLSPEECRTIAALYSHENQFRSHVRMAQHGFGKGEYRYFKYPLPDLLDGLRTALYPCLASVANEWNARMRIDERYPEDHASFLKRCHDAGQRRPTHFCCSMCRVISTASIRTSTALSHSQSRLRFFFQSPARISRAASSF